MAEPTVHTSLLDEPVLRVDVVVTLPSGVLAQTVQSIHCRAEVPAGAIYHGHDAQLAHLLNVAHRAVLEKFHEERDRRIREGDHRIPSREEVQQ